MGTSSRFVRPLLAIVGTVGLLFSQNDTRARAGGDPYTNGKPELIKQAGYVSLGPFDFGTGYTSIGVEELLGSEPLIWIETAHFKIGCALSPVKLRGTDAASKEWVKKTKAELDVLRGRLPNIKKRVKMLDPWLRGHLIALRLETLYSQVLGVLGRDEAWFEGPRDARDAQAFSGMGPYLGMRDKFTVLLLQKAASHARFTRACHGSEIQQPRRWFDVSLGSMYWGASEETAEGLFKNDMALHAHLNFNVAHNLYSAYRHFDYHLPAWVATGLGHYHSRNVSPRFPTFDQQDPDEKKNRSSFWQWGKRVKGLVKNEAFEPLAEFVLRDDAGKYGMENHMQSWAFMEFLLTSKPEECARFLHELKAPFHQRTRAPSADELKARQEQSLQAAFGCDVADLEKRWRESVLARRRR